MNDYKLLVKTTVTIIHLNQLLKYDLGYTYEIIINE